MWVARDGVTMCVFVGRGSDQRSMTLHVYLWEWLQVVRSCAGVNDTEIDYAGVPSDGQINASAKLPERTGRPQKNAILPLSQYFSKTA